VAARGYTTVALVQATLAQSLTAPQLDRCAALIEAAEHEVDRETGKMWLTTSPVSGELHTVNGPVVYLEHRPVATVTSVQIRPASVGQTQATLSAGTDYELIDAENGILLLSGYAYPRDIIINTEYTDQNGFLLTVSYTHTLVLDPAIQKITTDLVATWMTGTLGSDLASVQSFEVPDLVSVTYRDDAASSLSVPPDILRRLRVFEKVLFA
jgi:hypothetical protein